MELDFNYEKVKYKACCLQWDGYNTNEIIELIEKAGATAEPRANGIMVRWKDQNPARRYDIDVMKIGMWIRIGENFVGKLMNDDDFRLHYTLSEK